MFESLFEFLFKYRPLLYERGELGFGVPLVVMFVGVAVVVALVPTLLRYRDVRGKSTRRDRVILTALRTAALLLVLFCLFRPALVLSTVVPQQSFVGVLLDDSRSMQISDVDDQPRGAFIQSTFGGEGSALQAALADKFRLRYFRFSDSAERLNDPDTLSFTGARTHLSRALERSADELSNVPLAGLVVVTDGADNQSTAVSDTLLDLRARNVPVYTVGLGRERFTRDIEVSRVEAPRTVLEGSSLVVDVTISQRGFDGETVRLDVEDDGRIVSSREVTLSSDSETTTVRVHFTASDPGARVFGFAVATEPDEMVSQNNRREQLIYVEQARQKILYFEGEPRFELKFVRRAVADDENLQVVCLQRTAENKFLRLDVDDPDELAGGFPKTREELFRYRGIILGSVEASYFTHDQLRMIADFVSQRGGGLLVLGGRLALSEGGYAGTPIADVLPVTLSPRAGAKRGRGGRGARLLREARRRAHGLRHDPPGHAVRRRCERQRGALGDDPGSVDGQRRGSRQARRHHPARRQRSRSRLAAGAGVPALRARQVRGLHRERLVAVADASRDAARGHDPRAVLAKAAALARQLRSRPGHGDHGEESLCTRGDRVGRGRGSTTTGSSR